MPKRITVIDGHPDPDRARIVHALADAYAGGAEDAGRGRRWTVPLRRHPP